MKTLRILLIFFTTVVFLAFLTTAGLFTLKFYESPVSDNPEDWTNTISFYTLLFPALLTCLNLWLILKVNETNSIIAKQNLTFQKHKDRLSRVDKILEEYSELLHRLQTSFFDNRLPDNIHNIHQYLRGLFKYHSAYFKNLTTDEKRQKEILDNLIDFQWKTTEYNDLKNIVETSSPPSKEQLEERNTARKEGQKLREIATDNLHDIKEIIEAERDALIRSINSDTP